jgi:SAM-dependent methyltransferase
VSPDGGGCCLPETDWSEVKSRVIFTVNRFTGHGGTVSKPSALDGTGGGGDSLSEGRRSGALHSPKKSYDMAFNFNWALFDVLLKYLEPGQGETILDLGCSRGFYVRAMEAYTEGVVGVDISESSLKGAVSPRVRYGDITNLEFDDASFDKAYSLHTVEHLPNLRQFFAETARVLKPGGLAIVVYPWEPFRGFQAIVAAVRQYKNPFMARRIHLHRLTPGGLARFTEGTSLAHVRSKLVLALGIQYLTVLRKEG